MQASILHKNFMNVNVVKTGAMNRLCFSIFYKNINFVTTVALIRLHFFIIFIGFFSSMSFYQQWYPKMTQSAKNKKKSLSIWNTYHLAWNYLDSKKGYSSILLVNLRIFHAFWSGQNCIKKMYVILGHFPPFGN